MNNIIIHAHYMMHADYMLLFALICVIFFHIVVITGGELLKLDVNCATGDVSWTTPDSRSGIAYVTVESVCSGNNSQQVSHPLLILLHTILY